MFGWLSRPSCPCDPSAKAWIEERLEWLSNEFESSAFTDRDVILPTPEFFPNRYDGSEETVRSLLDQVCQYMDVVPSLVDMEFVSDAGKIKLVDDRGLPLGNALGSYHEGEYKFKVRIDRLGTDNPMGLIGTMAHELAHVRLLGESRISKDESDNELLTDLTTVHFGLGIFLANSPEHGSNQYSNWPNTKLRKPEYMTPPMFGWALAHLAWFRQEESPTWAKHLKMASRTNLKQGLRYLRETGDSWYKPK